MGKTYLLHEILSLRKRQGNDVVFLDCREVPPEQAADLICKTCSEVLKRKNTSSFLTLAIDDVPPFDECDTERAATILSQLAEAGVDVALALRPEAEMLCEALPFGICLRSADLVMSDPSSSGRKNEFWLRTHGIASLVASAYSDPFLLGSAVLGGRYLTCLAQLVRVSLRPCLPLEDRQLRLAMLLMGHGSKEELRDVVGRLDSDALVWLRRDAPLFGVGSRGDSFSCNPLRDRTSLEACAGVLEKALQTISGALPLAQRAAELLGVRGDYQRLAEVCALAPMSSQLIEPILRWGCELVAIGEAGLVSRTLERQLALLEDMPNAAKDYSTYGDEQSNTSDIASHMLLSSRALKVIGARWNRDAQSARHDERLPELPVRLKDDLPEEHLHLMTLARGLKIQIDEGGDLQNPKMDEMSDRLSRALCRHLQTRSLILHGRFSDAYRLLINTPERLGGLGLVSGLLANDYEIACILAGELPDAVDKNAFFAAQTLFKEAGGARLSTYHEMLKPALFALMARGGQVRSIEHACARAEASGDMLVQAALLLVASVTDLRLEMLSRGHVRACQSRDLARKAGCQYLAHCATLIDCVARVSMGDEEALLELEAWHTDASELRDLCRILICSRKEGATISPRLDVLSWEIFPRDLGWLIDFLACDAGAVSEGFRAALSPQWTGQLDKQHVRMRTLFDASQQKREAVQAYRISRTTESEQRRDTHRIRVNVLGRFEVMVDGKEIDPKKFQRRKARELLLLLCVARAHKVQRCVALDCIWATTDYVSGLQKIYDATSVIRSAVGMRENGCDPLISSKSEGSIALNVDLVTTDFDDFMVEARLSVSADSSDEQSVQHACNMTRLLPGGFEASFAAVPMDGCRQKKQLRSLYADAAVAGSDAALRLGRPHIAVRLAAQAHEAEPLREDAVVSLVEALGGLGRAAEARQLYEDFSYALIGATRTTPSLRLKKAAEKAVGGTDTSAQGITRKAG